MNHEEASLEEFLSPQESATFKSLVHVGTVTKDYTILDHKVTLKTTTVDEELQLGLLIAKFDGTPAFPRALRLGVVAATLRAIDGKPVFTPISPDDYENSVARRWDILSQYSPPFIDAVYQIINSDLNQDQLEIFNKISGKA